MNKYKRSHFMMDIYLKLRDQDEIDSSSREHWRFVGMSINFLAGLRRASVDFGDRTGPRFFKQRALEIRHHVRDRRIPGVSPPYVLRSLITVLYGPQGFLWANSFWSLL